MIVATKAYTDDSVFHVYTCGPTGAGTFLFFSYRILSNILVPHLIETCVGLADLSCLILSYLTLSHLMSASPVLSSRVYLSFDYLTLTFFFHLGFLTFVLVFSYPISPYLTSSWGGVRSFA